jgi:hypothetical protein
MTNKKYSITGGDDACYGPHFGPVIVEEMGEVKEGYGGPFMLVQLLHPVEFEREKVEHLWVTPRYVGDTLQTIRSGKCTVSFGRIRPGKLESARSMISHENSQTIAVGTSNVV